MVRRPTRASFTLVELLISIVVSAVVLLAVYTFFMVQTRSYETQEMSTELDSSMRFSQDLLSKAILGAGSMSTLGATTCSYAGLLGDVNDTSFVVNQASALECVQVIDSATEAAPDQLTTVVPDGSTVLRLALGASGGAGADCHGAVSTTVRQADDAAAFSAAQTLCSSGYRFVIWSDYGHPGTPRSFLRRAPTCVVNASDVVLTFAAAAAGTYTDLDTSCGSDELGPFIECAGAQIYTFYVADNSSAKLGNYRPADHVLFVSSDLDLYMRSGQTAGKTSDPTVAGGTRTDGLTTAADIPLATGITDLQVSGCARGLATTAVGCTLDADWTTEFVQGTNLAFEQYRVGLTTRSNKTFPGKQTQTPPVLDDGISYVTADNVYMYRATNFRVAAMPRLDTL